MKTMKAAVLFASITVAMTAQANFQYPDGSGIYFDIDGDGKAFVQYVDVNAVSGDVVIPESVEYDGSSYPVCYFGEYAKFYGAHAMTSVVIPSSISDIPGYWFQDCTNLASVTVGCKTIGENAFRGDAKLGSVILKDGVESIGAAALCELTSLKTITLPASITEIGSWQFYNNTSLAEITFNGNVPSIGSDFLNGVTSVTKITVPTGQKDSYIAALNAAGVTNAGDIVVESTTTGIESIVEDSSENDMKYYNLQGQPVDPDTKGIVIHNGKKYINK